MNFLNVFLTNPLYLVPVGIVLLLGLFVIGRKLFRRKRKSDLDTSVLTKAASAEDQLLANALSEADKERKRSKSLQAEISWLRSANRSFSAQIGNLAQQARRTVSPVKTIVKKVMTLRDTKDIPDSERVDYKFKCVDCRLLKRARVPKNTHWTNNKGVRSKKSNLRCVGCYRKHLVNKGYGLEKANKKVKAAYERMGMIFTNKSTASGLSAKGRELRSKDTKVAKAKNSFLRSLH